MKLKGIQRVLGLLLMVFSASMLPPLLVAVAFDDGEASTFVQSFVLVFALGTLAWFPVRACHGELRRRDGAVIVALFWVVLATAGAAPFLLANVSPLSITDAMFTSFAAITTTGAEVIVGLDILPESILFYRQWLQWLGGMGIVVLAVAILPLLGVGGMQLYRAETPGPSKDTKLTPRITQTAKWLWVIYLGFTLACTLGYRIFGMTWFDATGHAFSTVASGGLAMHDDGFAFFDSSAIEATAVVFMVLATINFSIHFHVFRRLALGQYWRDPESRWYLLAVLALCGFTAVYLVSASYYDSAGTAIRYAVFQAVSAISTTGFTATNFSAWPGMLPVLLILSSFIGACAYSTGGGMKVVRWILLIKQGWREVRRLVHPHAQFTTKIGTRPVSEKVVSAVWGFFSVYVVVFAALMILSMAVGLDHVTAFSAVASCLNNFGPALGEVASNYADIPGASKWVLMLAMLLGRLEIFTLLIILTPAFWKK